MSELSSSRWMDDDLIVYQIDQWLLSLLSLRDLVLQDVVFMMSW